jgi:hypothetical protein
MFKTSLHWKFFVCYYRAMCRNIKQLYNFEPHATSDEVQAAAAQFVKKISGFQKPSAANEAAFKRAIEDIAHASHHLLEDLVTQAAPRNRDVEAAKSHARSVQRFGT